MPPWQCRQLPIVKQCVACTWSCLKHDCPYCPQSVRDTCARRLKEAYPAMVWKKNSVGERPL